MYFLDNTLSKETHTLRQKLINHDLWKKITEGALEKKRLQIFALQDYWLINQARRIDVLTIAAVQDKTLQNLLIQRLTKQHEPEGTIFDFGTGVGLKENNFENITPLAGCMALTTFFYWMINYTTDPEKVAAIMTSVAIFSDICMRIYQPLMQNYHLNEKQVRFFSSHKHSEGKVHPISTYIEETYKSKPKQTQIAHAVHLSHEHELLFFDTILNTAI